MAPRAVTEPNTLHILHAVQVMENLADSMSLEKHWGKGAPELRALYQEMKNLIFSYSTARMEPSANLWSETLALPGTAIFPFPIVIHFV